MSLDLANTMIALPGGHVVDLLGTPAEAAAWLVSRDLAAVDLEMQEAGAAQLRALREQVRALLASHVDGHPAPAAGLHAINNAMTRVPTASLLTWDEAHGLHRVAEHPVTQVLDRALALLATDAAELLTGPDAPHVAACGSPSCIRYLLRTHLRRQWCSVRCGDRVRAARAYARRTGRA